MTKRHLILIILGVVLLLAVFIGIPCGLNCLILQPRWFEVVGDGTHWLSFWSGYLGAIISAGVALCILYMQKRQNEQLNQKSRLLQVSILKQQNAYNRFEKIVEQISIFEKYCRLNEVYSVVVNISDEKYDNDDYLKLKSICDDIYTSKSTLEYQFSMIGSSNNKEAFLNNFKELSISILSICGEIMHLIEIVRLAPINKDERPEYYKSAVEEMKAHSLFISLAKNGDYEKFENNVATTITSFYNTQKVAVYSNFRELGTLATDLMNKEKEYIDNLIEIDNGTK